MRLTIDRDVEGCKDINRVSGECWKASPPVVGKGPPGGNLSESAVTVEGVLKLCPVPRC